MMEILAPAGSFDTIVSAVRAGADAVYFGLNSFNARRNAKNITDDEIFKAVSYCHIRGVQAYLTLNTLISDLELQEALHLVKLACDAGIDGIIVQDLGLAKLIRQAAPKMPLHGSTQMTIHNVSGVKMLAKLGFSRVVLAREITKQELEEIAKVANQLNVEMEIFVQGALCMSMSGQCLLSAVLGSRSGNRGLCAGPCRLPFKVKDGDEFDLSLKDLNLYNHFEAFERMGVKSLKIEGRMKRPEYVAMAVDAAKCAINDKKLLPDKLITLQNVFSRSGFTDGYYSNNIDKNMFGIRSEIDIENTKQVLNSIHEIYRRERQSVAVSMEIEILEDKNVQLTVSDGKNTVKVIGDLPENAKTKSVDHDFLFDRLSKCGGTPYYLKHLKANFGCNLAVSSAQLSALKTEALDGLSQTRGLIAPVPFKLPTLQTESHKREPSKTFLSLNNINQLPDNPFIADMIMLPFNTDMQQVRALCEKGLNIAIKTPHYFFKNEKLLTQRLAEFKECGVLFAVAENLGAVLPILNSGLKLIGGSSLNLFNSHSITTLNFDKAILSYELSHKLIANISANVPIGIIAYGKMPLMLLRNCPIKARVGCKNCDGKITDRKNTEFSINCKDGCVRLFNDRPLYLADCPDIIKQLDFIVLQFIDEDKSTVEAVIKGYQRNLPTDQKFTRGLYVKGVK